jgi:hypothetical protein
LGQSRKIGQAKFLPLSSLWIWLGQRLLGMLRSSWIPVVCPVRFCGTRTDQGNIRALPILHCSAG